MNKSDFIIVGDTEKYKGCLVCVTAAKTFEEAEKELEHKINNPTENDKRIMAGHTNFRVKEIEADDCWWRWE